MLTSFLPTDKRVIAKMKELTRAGVRRAAEMRPLIRDYVCNVLFAGRPAPPKFDSRYWPSDKTIRNCIYSARMQARYIALLFFQYLSFILLCDLCNSFLVIVAHASIRILLCLEIQKDFAKKRLVFGHITQ